MIFEPDLNATSEELMQEARSESAAAQARVAGHPALSDDVIELLMASSHNVVRHVLASNPKISRRFLARLAACDPQLLEIVLSNASCPLGLVIGQCPDALPSWQVKRVADSLLVSDAERERFYQLVGEDPLRELGEILATVNPGSNTELLSIAPFRLPGWR